MSDSEKFNLAPGCVLVVGGANSAIYDLDRKKIYTFPSHFNKVIRKLVGLAEAEIKQYVAQVGDAEDCAGVLSFLTDNELSLYSAVMPASARLSQARNDGQTVITNAILDIGIKEQNIETALAKLEAIGCEFLQVRVFRKLIDLEVLARIGSAAADTSLRGIEVLLPYTMGLTSLANLNAILTSFPIFSLLVVYGTCSSSQSNSTCNATSSTRIKFTSEHISSCADCGNISLRTMVLPDRRTFEHLKSRNGCLYGKISIDVNGVVGNCPSMPQTYGSIGEVNLDDVVSQLKFQSKGLLHKDLFKTCNRCEYRYACSDCRAYLQDSADNLSKPLKCAYDPKTGIWGSDKNDQAFS